jgi:hypothetical protein
MADFKAPPRTSFVTNFLESLLRDRGQIALVACAVLVAAIYIAVTFDPAFLTGHGTFWANPRGPWLVDSKDTVENIDILDYQVGYLGFLKTDWHLPIFFVPNLGAPAGTNIIFVDATPIVALLGKLASGWIGHPINPYGYWIAGCFVLSAVFATLFVIELGQRSLLAAIAASILALSAPTLLHRFGHLPLLAHFVVIGALLLYLLDRHAEPRWKPTLRWAGWLGLAILINMYLFVMAAAIYAASLLRRIALDRPHWRAALREPLIIGCALALVTAAAGHFGRGTRTGYPGAPGFGQFSMNLASPFWPQRSGLFSGFDPIIDATGGQYEGFSYFGMGSILLIFAAVVLNRGHFRQMIVAHRQLFGVLICLTAFAVSHRVFLGSTKLLDLDFSWQFNALIGVFRSSGRMFWPMLYAVMLGSLVIVLRRLPPGPKAAFVVACCVLQLADTEPLRSRMTTLSRLDVPTLLDRAEWQERMMRSAAVRVDPPIMCFGPREFGIANMELQLAAMATERPINSVYNPRLKIDCTADAASARTGPWRDDTLYVFLAGEPRGVPVGWMPTGLACQPFKLGIWCLGPKPGL